MKVKYSDAKLVCIGFENWHMHEMVKAFLFFGVKPVAIADKNKDISKIINKLNLDDIALYKDWRKMLDKTKPNIVLTASSLDMKPDVIVESMERGIRVAADKPIAQSLEKWGEIVSAYYKTKTKLNLLLEERFNPMCELTYEVVKQDMIGNILSIMGHKSTSFAMENRPEWFFNADKNGLLPFTVSHHLDFIHWWTNRNIVSVQAKHFNERSPGLPKFKDHGQVLLKLDNDCYSYFTADFMPGKSQYWHGCHLYGTKGYLSYSAGEKSIQLQNENGVQYMSPSYDIIDYEWGWKGMVYDFLNAFIADKEAKVDTDSVLRTGEWIAATHESALNGGKEIMMKGIEYVRNKNV